MYIPLGNRMCFDVIFAGFYPGLAQVAEHLNELAERLTVTVFRPNDEFSEIYQKVFESGIHWIIIAGKVEKTFLDLYKRNIAFRRSPLFFSTIGSG